MPTQNEFGVDNPTEPSPGGEWSVTCPPTDISAYDDDYFELVVDQNDNVLGIVMYAAAPSTPGQRGSGNKTAIGVEARGRVTRTDSTTKTAGFAYDAAGRMTGATTSTTVTHDYSWNVEIDDGGFTDDVIQVAEDVIKKVLQFFKKNQSANNN